MELLRAGTCYALYWPESWDAEDQPRSEGKVVAFGGEMHEAPAFILSPKGKAGACRDGSVVKDTSRSCRGPKFKSLHQCQMCNNHLSS